MYVNETFAKMVGYSVSELIGMSAYDLVAPDYVKVIEERTINRQQGKDVVSVYEIELVRRDGSRFPVEINVNRIDYMGKSSSLTTIRDITHKKETEQRFEDLLRLAPVSIMTYSITGHISSCNQATSDMTGYSNEELVGKHLTQLPFFNLKTLKMVLPLLGSLISGQAIGPVDFPYKSKTGENKYARAYPRLVTSGSGGREILVVIEDTTESTKLVNAIQESEELFRGFMHSATDAFTIFDQDMRFEEVNRSWIQMTNNKKEDVIGKHILDIYIGLRETGRYDAYLKVLETGEPVEFYAVQTKVGGGMIYDVSAFKVGNMLGVVAKDVTERTLISESLRASEERFRLLYENAPLGYQSLDENGCLIEVSKAWLLLTGYTQDEVIGKWFGDFLTPQYIDQFRLNFPRFKAKGETQVQFEMMRKDESIILVSIFGKVGYNAKREFQQTHCILEDVTEKNRIENKLRSSEDLFRGFMQSSTEAFLLLDKSMQYIDVNDTWLQQSGLKREEVIGKHMLELFPELKDNGRYDAYVKVMETGEPVEFPIVPSVVGQGTVFDISAFSTGDYLGIISRDVSDRLRYQSRLEALHGHAASLSSAETMDEVANITREYLVQNFGFNLGALSIVENDLLANRYIWGAEPIQNSFTRLDGPGIIVEVVKTGKTQNIGDVRENPLYIAGFSGEVILSELAVPVMISGKAIGVLNLESDALDAYSENDQRLVETLASHVASAFSKIKYNERMNELYEFSIELGTTESVNEVVATSLRIMREVFGFQFSSFQLLDEDGLVSVGTTDNSNLGVVFPLSGKGITTRAARDKRTMLVGDVSLDPDYIKWSMDSRSELAVPIMREDRVLGVLNVESLTFEAFSDDDARLLELLAQNVEAALYRVRSVADRKQVTDALLLSEERLSGFMESATESFILLDSELNILDANPTWLKLTGFSQTVIGKNLQNVLPANDIMSSRYSAYKRVIETGQPIEFNQTVSPSNENVFYDVKAFKVDDGVGVIVTDVTEQTIAKQMLEASESRFRGLFENLIVGYGHQQMVYDEQGKPVDYIFLAGNEAFEQFTGLVLDDIIGKRVTEVLPGIENDPANWIGIYGKIASEGGSTFFEQFVESLGMWYKIQVYSTEKGYFTTIFENITDRKRTEQELEALARFPGENTNPVLRINNEGTILYANRTATQELTGWAPKIGDEVSGEGLSIVTSTLSSGEKSVYERVYGDRVFSFILAPIVESGYVNVYGRDVTEELRLETRIKTIQTHANELSNTSNTIEIAQKSLNIIKTSLGFNYSSFQIVEGDELVTLEYFDDTYPEGGNRSEFLRLPISGKGITTKVVRERKTILINDLSEDPDFIKGSMDSSLSELAVPIISEGTVIGVLNIESPELGGFNEADARVLEVLSQNVGSALFRIQAVEDRLELERQLISEQIRVEQEHELGELKDQFIATATHELRTPVTSILGYIELIMEDPNRIISDPVRKDLNVVLRNSHRLVSFVNDLLDVQRITAGKLEAKLEPADLVSALDQVVGEMSHLFSEKDQVLRVEAPERVVMSVDEPRVSQLFINLLRNANKFTPKGGQVTVSVEPEENHVRVSVKDSGVGLSVEDIGKLFVPFPSINRELGGTSTGLGLAICKGIVDMHGGEIWAESEGHGKGSTFTFTLPIEK